MTLNTPPSSHFDIVIPPPRRHYWGADLHFDHWGLTIPINTGLKDWIYIPSDSHSFANMVDTNVETTTTDPAASSLENDKTVNDDAGTIVKSGAADGTVEREGQVTGEVDQVLTDSKADGEDTGKPAATDESHKAVIEGTKKTDQATSDSPNKNAAANGKLGATSHDRDTGNRGLGNKRGGHQGGRKFEDFRKNVKTDFTSQKESSDPNEIRKQVCHARTSLLERLADPFRLRSNSISPMQILLRTSSFWRRLAVARITPSPSRLYTRSSACATSNPSQPSLQL